MIKVFHTDVHIGATNQLGGFSEKNLDPSNENEWVLGDVFDLTNCKKKDVKKIQEQLDHFRKLYGRRFITGNHEAQKDSDQFQWIDQSRGIAAMHGDFIFWGQEKSLKYRFKDHGAGFLKRLLWVNAVEAIEKGYDRQVNGDDLKRFSGYCKASEIKVLIVGHMHPKKTIKIYHDGLVLIVLKRGTTMLDLSKF